MVAIDFSRLRHTNGTKKKITGYVDFEDDEDVVAAAATAAVAAGPVVLFDDAVRNEQSFC